ncbi:MAG: hypothetical protein ACXABY_05215 [Candidatus Thorarchaeota archaeon]|jgi:hypothetical protein
MNGRVVLPLILIVILSLSSVSFINQDCFSSTEIHNEESRLIIESLIEYENWVSSNFAEPGTTENETQYPHFLSGFAELYRGLAKFVDEKYYAIYDRILSYLISTQTNWTWFSDYAGFHPHFNKAFAKAFLDAYVLTGNTTYLFAFNNTIRAFSHFFDGENISPAWNSNFYAFTQIAVALSMGLVNSSYYDMALRLLNYSLSYYNQTTAEWYHIGGSKYPNGYNGRGAYYQLLALTWFLRYKTEIHQVFPEVYSNLIEIAEVSIDVIDRYVLPTGTFYYLPSVLEYTESVSIVMYGFTLLDREFNSDHREVINASIQTMIQRQNENGTYYQSNNTVIELAYTDNIPQWAWHYVESLEEISALNSENDSSQLIASACLGVSALIIIVSVIKRRSKRIS